MGQQQTTTTNNNNKQQQQTTTTNNNNPKPTPKKTFLKPNPKLYSPYHQTNKTKITKKPIKHSKLHQIPKKLPPNQHKTKLTLLNFLNQNQTNYHPPIIQKHNHNTT